MIRDKEGLLAVPTVCRLGSYLGRSNLDILVRSKSLTQRSDNSMNGEGKLRDSGAAVSPTTRDNPESPMVKRPNLDTTSSLLLAPKSSSGLWSVSRTLNLKAQLKGMGLPIKSLSVLSAYALSRGKSVFGDIIVFEYIGGITSSSGNTHRSLLMLIPDSWRKAEAELVLRVFNTQFGKTCTYLVQYKTDGQLALAKLK
jgi:hypothetical protein